jgi:hypothetical protein
MAHVTVFIPTYNRLENLKRAVHSVFECGAQVHLHILDNCSIDGTDQWLNKISSNAPISVQITKHPKNLGAKANYAAGFRSVCTPYLVPLADDDELVPGFLSEAIKLASHHPEIIAVIGARAHKSEGAWYPHWDSRRSVGVVTPQVNIVEFLRYGHHTTWSAMLWRTHEIQAHDLFARAAKFGIPSDIYFQFSAFMIGSVYVEPLPAASFNFSPGQASSTIGLSQGSIYDLGTLADAIINEVVAAGYFPEKSDAIKLFSESARRWAKIIRNNRESAIQSGQNLEFGPCIAQYFDSLYPYCGMDNFPFISEISAIASSFPENSSCRPNVQKHDASMLRKFAKQILNKFM